MLLIDQIWHIVNAVTDFCIVWQVFNVLQFWEHEETRKRHGGKARKGYGP